MRVAPCVLLFTVTALTSLFAATIAALMLAACANQATEPAADTAAVSTDLSKNAHFAAADSQLTSRLKLQTLGERREGVEAEQAEPGDREQPVGEVGSSAPAPPQGASR